MTGEPVKNACSRKVQQLADQVEQLRAALQTYADADPADPDTWNSPHLARKTLEATFKSQDAPDA